jgi:hypothetical protein
LEGRRYHAAVIHPDTELRTAPEPMGVGVYVTRFIPKGTVVWVRDDLDQVLSSERVATLPEILQQQVRRYSYIDGGGSFVLGWDHVRFMNHSCDPATACIGTLIEIARRDLQPGDELTCEYGLDHTVVKFDCACGAPNCRGTLLPKDRNETWRRWDAEAEEAYAWALTVPQPLLAALRRNDPGEWIVQAIRERQQIELPKWANGVPGGW